MNQSGKILIYAWIDAGKANFSGQNKYHNEEYDVKVPIRHD